MSGLLAVDVRGGGEIKKLLAQFDEKSAKPLLQKATNAGAKAIKPYVVAAAPRGATGRLRRSVSARKANRDLPASVVSARPKIAFYRHMVIGGTKDHGPRKARFLVFQGNHLGAEGAIVAKHVRGTKARPFVDEGYRSGEGAALAAIDRVIEQALGAIK